MRKLIIKIKLLIVSSLCSSAAIATTGDLQIRKVYDDLQARKTAFFNSNILKNDFAQKFKNLDKELKAKYSQLKVLEGDALSVEGNQTALDLELLEPLRILASNKITKNSCYEAKHQNKLNASPDEKDQIQTIENLITRLCK